MNNFEKILYLAKSELWVIVYNVQLSHCQMTSHQFMFCSIDYVEGCIPSLSAESIKEMLVIKIERFVNCISFVKVLNLVCFVWHCKASTF